MVAFPINAPTLSFGINTQKDYRILSASFGDGYTVRTGDGLNTEIEKWNMTWDLVTQAEKDILINFFDDREGFQPFDFIAPGEVDSKKWVVKGVKVTPINATYYRVDAVFDRVYDL